MHLLPPSLAAVAIVLCAGCTPGRGVSEGGAPALHRTAPLHPWTQPDMLRVAVSISPNTLDPILSTQQVELQLEALMFDPLVATDPQGRDVPVLAARVPTVENHDISADGRTIVYHLRHGVRWQDGVPFTSHDVVFTWHAIANPATAVASRHGYDRIARIDAPDPYTAIFHLTTRFAPAIHTFFAHSDTVYTPLPAHLLERYHDLNRVPFNAMPIGTGPYHLTKWIRGDRLEYVANDRYFLGKPKIPKIVVHIVPDENTIVNEMRTHEIDWFMLATPHVYPQLRAIAGVTVRLVPFNGADSIEFNTQREPFSDARLRRAVGLAVDKPRLVRDVTYGTALAATEDLPSFLWAFDPTAGTSARDLPAAKRLLDEAGWRVEGDGIRSKAGKRLTLSLAFRTDSSTDRNRGVVIATMLKDAGIEVELKGYTTALYYGPYAEGGILASGKYEAGLQTWYAGVDPDDSAQLLCSERPPHGYNWTRYCNPELDRAEATALSSYDRPARSRAYATVQHLLARDAPFVYLWWPRQIEAVNDDLRAFRPNGIIEDWNAYAWHFAS